MTEDKKRTCRNCKNRAFSSWPSVEYCAQYDMCCDDEKLEEETAIECNAYEYGTPSVLEKDEYTPCCTFGDYSPSSPWNAPGMSVRDFV